MSSTEEVLSNRDLVRHLLSISKHATPLISSSKRIRTAQTPCATLFERWAHEGCPIEPTGNEVHCLASIGGHDAPFCGVYELIEYSAERVSSTTATDVSPQKVARDVVGRLLAQPHTGTSTLLVLTLGDTILSFERHPTLTNTIAVTRDGWRRKSGMPCRPTDDEVTQFLTRALTRTLSLALPCAHGHVQVKRSITVELYTRDKQRRDHLLLTAVRS